MVEWTTGAVAAPNYTSRNQVSGQLQRLDEAGKFTKEATVLTEEAVAKTAVAFSATAELISTTMRGSTKAAAAMLIRLTRGNEARAAAVLENVMHTSSSSVASRMLVRQMSPCTRATAVASPMLWTASWRRLKK